MKMETPKSYKELYAELEHSTNLVILNYAIDRLAQNKEEKINLRDELRSHKFEFDLLQKIPCTKQENKEYQKLLKDGGTLPEGVYAYVYDVVCLY